MPAAQPAVATRAVLQFCPDVGILSSFAGAISRMTTFILVAFSCLHDLLTCKEHRRRHHVPTYTQEVSSGAKERRSAPPVAAPAAAYDHLVKLPQDLSVEVARMLDLPSLAAAGATSTSAQSQLWQDPGVWSALAVRSSVDLSLFAGQQSSGVAVRSAFRRLTHNLDIGQLEALSGAVQDAGGAMLADMLQDLAHTARGLMPSDGARLADLLCSVAEQALQAHDPTHAASAAAAERMMCTIRRCDGVFCWQQRECLEYARASAVHVQDLMEDLDGKAQADTATPEGDSLPDQSFEGAHEEDELLDLSGVFGELCSRALGDPVGSAEDIGCFSE